MYSYILMDLDGTLTDPGLGITNSIMYGLEKLGIIEKDRTKLYRFIGPPLMEELRAVYHLSEQEGLNALAYYREYFSVTGLFENEVYEGIPEVLGRIRDAGRKLIVATSKPEIYTKRILEHFDLEKYFDFVAGSTMDSSRVQKSDVIAYAVNKMGFSPGEALMVGDRKNDIEGAAANGMKSLGVLYGYGSYEELSKAGADCYARTPEEILYYI